MELAALGAVVLIGITIGDGVLGIVIGVVLALVAGVIWGVFRVPGDPGEAIVPVPGSVRLGIEVVLLAGVVWGVWHVGFPVVAVALGTVVLVQYWLAWSRVVWLLGSDEFAPDVLDPRA